jgi:hypothetical protein
MNDEDLRDLFAGLAMQAIIHEIYADNLADHGSKSISTKAYYIADAMIEAKYAKEEPEQGITSVIKRTRKAK